MTDQMQQNTVTRSGNKTLVIFNGKQYGLIQSVRMSDDYAPEMASGIGDIEPVEYVPTVARYTLSVSKMTLLVEKMRKNGIFVENGNGALKGLVFDFNVVDKASGAVLVTYSGCSYASGDVDISKNAITMASGQFYALRRRGTGV